MRQITGVPKRFLEKVTPIPIRWGGGGISSRQVGHRDQKPRDKTKGKSVNGHEFGQTLGDGEGQGSLAHCSPESKTRLSDWKTAKSFKG